MELEKLKSVILSQMGPPYGKITEDMLTPNATFAEDLGADSLDIFQIITELEEAYGMEFSDEAAESIKTLGDAADYIQKALAK